LREGCSVIITLMNDTTFEGSTVGSDCKSKMRGAKYATSEVQISPSIIKIRDRGFDENGIQVWGAEKGGYIFKRTK
ncbi:MAG: CpcT/CpeT family chromophore lyase, partial [Bacteroidota bacterium]|nr:CpcT/CpeT family chromophore lyase [Bacteroidota bacterium]